MYIHCGLSQAELELRIYRNLTNSILSRARNAANNNLVGKREYGSYHYVPFTTYSLVRMFGEISTQVLRYSPVNYFLDAGCGIGNVVAIAKAANLAKYCHGIEYSKEIMKTGKALFMPTAGMKFILDDILTFKNYGRYDIIYYYCPFSNPGLQILFEERLEDMCKIGAIIIPLNKQGWAYKEDSRFEELRGRYYHAIRKIKNGKRKNSNFNSKDCDSIVGANERVLKRYPNLREYIDNRNL